jgi:hypothetical protein
MVAPLVSIDPVAVHVHGLAHPFNVVHAATTPYHGTVAASSTTTTINITGKTTVTNTVGLRIRFLRWACCWSDGCHRN